LPEEKAATTARMPTFSMNHCHEELEHAEAALVARAQMHVSAIGIPL